MIFGIFGKLRDGLRKTREKFSGSLARLFTIGRKIDDAFLDELEETLITADIGVKTATRIIGDVKEKYRMKEIKEASEILGFLKNELKESIQDEAIEMKFPAAGVAVILVVGINGTGKTTSIAKLAWLYKKQGKRVLLAASDTFRAAASEQLSIWAERVGVDIIKHKEGADPAAVTFDAIEAALARDTDVLIIDTAGRLHTKTNLMNELEKIKRVIGKKIDDAPHEVLLVLDATTGQNAVMQAKEFRGRVDVTGLFLSKLDGTAKGGIVIGMKNEIDIPVKFIGTGEKMEDIEVFDKGAFVDALFE